ncbi:CYTH and CHAD domain-containing protein [Streptomyces sp. A3M-1-3]|uniref:CYTH and CHAD domain-containing protein n=1 Tax=Streptomyces sp. A3M-1-3 TaxID=2962044 RepID=UPI0020B750D8|nr:CYTH and CHAD domain-containing protein [Streptomyces sp. A3M-1-3]MCP3817713.1 CYTH and CHAD domain-containing protein [Streptomyces sp. A3M-1-3]
MADTKREIERKFEFTAADGRTRLPDLTRVAGVAAVVDQGVMELDATYYDTPGRRLAADSITLRRRTGGSDEGWHLKLPVAPGVRDEIRAPLTAGTAGEAVPRDLLGLVRSRVRDTELVPLVRLLSSRDVLHLVDGDGTLLAELSTDTVRAERLVPGGGTAEWTEIEVELADGGDPAFLDAVEKKLRKAGARVSDAPSKLARALAETEPRGKAAPAKPTGGAGQNTSASHVLGYLREQVASIVAHDPAVRRDLPDSVHQMRVATRRLRSAFKTYRKVLDRTVTDPLGDELKWLGAELGVDRDLEVLTERLESRIAEVPGTLLLGPVAARLRIWTVSRRSGSRRKTLDVLDSKRYLALLESLDVLLADPPLRSAASRSPHKLLPKAVLGDYDRLAGRVEHALALDPGEERDVAMHEARKAAKRARYAAELADPALGKPARRFAKRMKSVQTLLGDHQDSVVARESLRTLAIEAQAAGESAFTWGLLYGHEEAQAVERERELPEVWAKASRPALRDGLTA